MSSSPLLFISSEGKIGTLAIRVQLKCTTSELACPLSGKQNPGNCVCLGMSNGVEYCESAGSDLSNSEEECVLTPILRCRSVSQLQFWAVTTTVRQLTIIHRQAALLS